MSKPMGEPMGAIKGMAWDHPRATAPLRAASELFAERYGVTVSWDARPLQGFEEESVSDLAARYDLIAIDHPFMGSAYRDEALLPVESLLSGAFLAELRDNSVGPSWDSYRWEGHTWAVPVDAAAQVAASRPELLRATGTPVPATWDEVRSLADSAGRGQVALPANSTHLLLTLATVCHGLAGVQDTRPDARPDTRPDLTPAWWGEDGIDPEVGEPALDILLRLLDKAHPMSLKSDPIQILDHMTRTDEISYVPVVFGYSNYARPDEAPRPASFTAVPSPDGRLRGGMLGGVGLAVSRRLRAPERVVPFLEMVAGAAFQSGPYAASGGQPAHRQAWTSTAVNGRCPNFFEPTLDALDVSFVRPRTAWYPRFQREGGEVLHEAVRTGAGPAAALTALRRCQQAARKAYSSS
jgi:multiple sugar transport system substrate-binding protein